MLRAEFISFAYNILSIINICLTLSDSVNVPTENLASVTGSTVGTQPFPNDNVSPTSKDVFTLLLIYITY